MFLTFRFFSKSTPMRKELVEKNNKTKQMILNEKGTTNENKRNPMANRKVILVNGRIITVSRMVTSYSVTPSLSIIRFMLLINSTSLTADKATNFDIHTEPHTIRISFASAKAKCHISITIPHAGTPIAIEAIWMNIGATTKNPPSFKITDQIPSTS